MSRDNQKQQLERERDQLQDLVFSGRDADKGTLLRRGFDPSAPVWVDPDLHNLLHAMFNASPAGRDEWLRMEVDRLRRLSLSRETEWIHRPFGVVELCVPVVADGKLIHALFSGPVKLKAWSSRDLQTLSKVSHLAEARFPKGLTEGSYQVESGIFLLQKQMERQAMLLADMWMWSPVPEGIGPPHPPQLAPLETTTEHHGFIEHLSLLFQTITQSASSQASEADGLRATAERGLGMTREWLARYDVPRTVTALHLHEMLGSLAENLQTLFPGISTSFDLLAPEDTIRAPAGSVQHLFTTLLSAMADSLSSSGGTLHVKTTNESRNGDDGVVVSLRDSGGTPTFSGVDPVLDHLLEQEQNEAENEYVDWMKLAENLEAQLHIRTEEQTVTCIELFLPFQTECLVNVPDEGGPQLWIVDDDPEWVTILRHLLPDTAAQVTQLSSGTALMDHYPSAPLPPDLIILDMHLGDMRGDTLRTWLYEQDADLPVVLLSSMNATHPGIQTAVGLPKTSYLQKPFDERELGRILSMSIHETRGGE